MYDEHMGKQNVFDFHNIYHINKSSMHVLVMFIGTSCVCIR